MCKKICLSLVFSLAISLFPNQQHEKAKDLNKRAIDQAKIGNDHYEAAIKKMRNKDYMAAIAEFKNAMKRYKRAKLGADAYNYIHTNMALCYVSAWIQQAWS